MRLTNGPFIRPSARLLACVVLCGFLSVPLLRSQDDLKPDDVWQRGYLLVQAANDLEAQGRYLEALNKLNEATPFYNHLAQNFPEFYPDVVRDRRHLIAEQRDRLKTAMDARNRAPATPAQPPVGQPQASSPVRSLAIAPPPINDGEFADSHHGGGMVERSMEIQQSGDIPLPSWGAGSSQALRQDAPSMPGMPQVRTTGRPSVGAIASDLYDDLARKDELIRWLNEENQKLRADLKQRDLVIEKAKRDLAAARMNQENLLRQKAAEEAAGGGVDAQQRIENLKKLLADAIAQVEEVTKRNEKLVAGMEQSQAEMAKMQRRMAELERERDNLAEVVRGEGNGGKALKELMDRNRTLTEQLDRAEQLAASLSELNKEKDDDIALLKNEITRIKVERDQLLAENLRHQQSIEELQHTLERLSDGLSPEDKKALATATPAERQENEMLRSHVLQQLRRQAQRKQAKELLLAQLERIGARSDALLGLVEDMARGSQLSEEVKALFKAPQFEELLAAAGEEPSKGASHLVPVQVVGPPAPVKGGSTAVMSATLVAAGKAPDDKTISPDDVVERKKLSVELVQIDKSARLDFKEGRYSEAEAGFLEYLRYLPQSVPCLCNLGVLKTAMKNYSEAEYYLEKAIAIEANSGLANYLLGRVYFLQDKFDEALEKLETGLTYDPQNAKAHNCVGVISSRNGWVARAERAFTNAVSIDPDYADAHFNLALLHATKDDPNPQEAGKHYFRALHLGIPRDDTIEGFLKQAEEAGVPVGMR